MPVRLRFSAESGVTPWIVRAYTWSPWDHVEIWLPEGYLGARPRGGVAQRRLDYLTPQQFKFATIPWTPERSDRFIATVRGQIGKPYDWAAIYGIATHHDWRDDGQWICSELIAWGAERVGDPLLNVNQGLGGDETNRFSPRDIALARQVIFDVP